MGADALLIFLEIATLQAKPTAHQNDDLVTSDVTASDEPAHAVEHLGLETLDTDLRTSWDAHRFTAAVEALHPAVQ